MNNKNFTINKELEDFLPALEDNVFQSLEAEIIADGGCRDSLVIWQEEKILVDGHNRIRICEKNGLPLPKIIEKSFKSLEDVKYWMIIVQDSRRSFTDAETDYFRGMRYSMEKSGHGGDRKSSGKNCNLKTQDRLAAEFGKSPRTIINNEKYYEVLKALGEISQDAKKAILKGKADIKRKDVIALNDCPEEKLRSFAINVMSEVNARLNGEYSPQRKHKGGYYVDDRDNRGYLEILPSTSDGWHYSLFIDNFDEHVYSKRPMTWYGITIWLSLDEKFTEDELIPFNMKPIDIVESVLYSKNGEHPNKYTEQRIKELAREFLVNTDIISKDYRYYLSISLIRKISPDAAIEIAEEANRSPWGMRDIFDIIWETDSDDIFTKCLDEIIDGERDYRYLIAKYKYGAE